MEARNGRSVRSLRPLARQAAGDGRHFASFKLGGRRRNDFSLQRPSFRNVTSWGDDEPRCRAGGSPSAARRRRTSGTKKISHEGVAASMPPTNAGCRLSCWAGRPGAGGDGAAASGNTPAMNASGGHQDWAQALSREASIAALARFGATLLGDRRANLHDPGSRSSARKGRSWSGRTDLESRRRCRKRPRSGRSPRRRPERRPSGTIRITESGIDQALV